MLRSLSSSVTAVTLGVASLMPPGHRAGLRPSGSVLPACPGDSTYASTRLHALVDSMAARGREIPPALRGFHGTVESEVAVLLRTAAPRDGVGAGDAGNARGTSGDHAGGAMDGRERALQVEQIESTVDWSRDRGREQVEQHVVGYRSRGVTAGISAMTYLRTPWVVPVLYGNRLQVMLGRGAAASSGPADSAAAGESATGSDRGETIAVHPFAADRERYYRFTGGNIVSVIHLQGRRIPIARIAVEPRGCPAGRVLLFRGEVDVDADRHQVVRMRGQFVVARTHRSVVRRLLASTWQTVVLAELTNAEFDGRFWLPREQRVEAQGRSALASGFRPTFRVVSRFRDYALDTTSDATADSGVADGATSARRMSSARLTFAPRDSITAFRAWSAEIGATTASVRSDDFDDVSSDAPRARGAPRFELRAERLSDVLRFNRVEGAFTGLAGTFRFGSAAPGLAVGGSTGWAWSEATARGDAWLRWQRGPWVHGVRAERALANTNDFRPLLDLEQSFAALLATSDDYDYVDRRALSWSASRALPAPGSPVFRLSVAAGHDAAERTRLRYGLVHLDSTFRPNRPVAAGSYARTTVGIDAHPGVTGEFLEPGIGGGLWYERGDGGLRWQRVEARVAARHVRGPVSYAGRVDGIFVTSPAPVPQQLIEFGENEGLPGYAYKEFGGDRAVLGHLGMSFDLPGGRAPVRIGGTAGRALGGALDRLIHGGGPALDQVYLPALSPSIAVGLNGAWSAAVSPSTRAALAAFGTRIDTLTGAPRLATRPTDGVRSTVSLTFRLFGGTLGAGLARPIDGRDPKASWRFILSVGQPF